MKVIALIPARKGSKRIKGKNTRKFLGTPIIQHTVNSIELVSQVSDIYVSTDDKRVEELLSKSKCTVVKRDENLCDDYATSLEVVMDFAENINYNFDIIAMIYPATPNLDICSLKNCITLLSQSKKMHSAASLVKYQHPLERRLKKIGNGFSFEEDDSLSRRTQDLEERYHDAANFYLFKRSFFKEKKSLFDGFTLGKEISRKFYFDIDVQEDWDFAELVLRNEKN